MAKGQRKWTRDEEDLLLEWAPQLSSSAIGERLGRSGKSVQRKAAQMGIAIKHAALFGQIPVLGYRDDGRPIVDTIWDAQGHTIIGARTLLAKTCPGCGRFLPARRYYRRAGGKRDGHWYVQCKGCTSDLGNVARPDRDRSRGKRVADQESTQRAAVNDGRPWTAEDERVLADTSLSLMQVALQLGRTLHAVQTRAHALGIHRAQFADVGKKWVLYFAGRA